MPRNGIAGPYGSSIFGILMNLHTVLHSGWINLYFHGQYKRVPSSPHLSSIHCLYIFLMMGILTKVRWYFNVVFICNNAEHFFMSLLTIYTSFLEKSLFSSWTHFKNFFILSCLYILEINPLLVASLGNIFSNSCLSSCL